MTIKDIARLSGYSLGTVSRVLNHHPDVSDAARERVMEVVRDHGFQPNANARHLKMQAQSAVAVLVKGTQNLLFADLLERVQALMQENGEEVYAAYLDEEDDEVRHAVQLSRLRRPKGFLFLGGDLEHFRADFHALTEPCVLLTSDAGGLGFPNLSSFSTNDAAAAGQMIDYLLSCGHRHIGVLGGNLSGEQISRRRICGVCESMERRGLPFDLERRYEPCRYSMADGYAAARRLLEREPGLTALFALSDVIALGAIRALRDLGLRVPEDVSVAGCDGIALANYSVPRLTTVCQDTAQMAERGVRGLLQGIRVHAPPACEEIPFRLLLQESVCPPGGR